MNDFPFDNTNKPAVLQKIPQYGFFLRITSLMVDYAPVDLSTIEVPLVTIKAGLTMESFPIYAICEGALFRAPLTGKDLVKIPLQTEPYQLIAGSTGVIPPPTP